jgi:hypothetical protein
MCSRRSRARCSSTTLNRRTCSTSPERPARWRRSGDGRVGPVRSASGRSCCGSSTRSPPPRSCATAGSTTWPPILSAARCTRHCSTAVSSRRIAPASRFWTRQRRSSTSTGSALPGTSSRTCARKPAATRTTVACRIWSANCRPAAPSSAPGGRLTTSATTKQVRSGSATRSSASSSSTTRSWTSPPTTG